VCGGVQAGEDIAYLISLLDWAASAVEAILTNFAAIRPAMFCGILLGM
jgi:hypothetical protein